MAVRGHDSADRVAALAGKLDEPLTERLSSDVPAGDGKVWDKSAVEVVTLDWRSFRRGRKAAFRSRWSLRMSKTLLAVAFGGGQAYPDRRLRIENGNSGFDLTGGSCTSSGLGSRARSYRFGYDSCGGLVRRDCVWIR